MRNRLLLIMGIALLALGVGLFAVLQFSASRGEKTSRQTVEKLLTLLPERWEGTPYADVDMPVLQMDGVDYVAILEIPSFGLTLPVANQWDGNGLFDAPARFYGSCYGETFVVGGVDREYQFAFCDKIENGTQIIVTDMTGAQFVYEVTRVERSDRADGQWLIREEYPLTLFCRDTYSMEYIAVRCARS